MSANPETEALEAKRRQINRLIQEIEQYSESPISPGEYFAEFLQRVLTAIAAPAGVVWLRTPQGHLQLQHQVNFAAIGLDKIENGQASHAELLRATIQQARPRLIPPRSGAGGGTDGPAGQANLTPYVLLIAPILIEKQIAGLVEIFQDPERPPEAMRGFLRFVAEMAELASRFIRNTQLRQMHGQQQVWTQFEAFSRAIHNSLNPREVCYQVVNEGRRLLQVDRVSVATRLGSSTKIEAISGADVIEKRSSLVQTMRELCNQVLVFGEKLVYSGTKDESLPPKVLHALDKYLEEANSKLLIVLPMKDEREAELKRPCRSAILVESFEPTVTAEQIGGRLDVVVKHAAPAVYNAVEMKRLPFRWLLQPLANVKDHLRGNRGAIAAAIAASVLLIGVLMAVVPWTLRMEAKGALLPKNRQTVYSRIDGQITHVAVRNGVLVNKGQELLKVQNLALQAKVNEAQNKLEAAQRQIAHFEEQLTRVGEGSERNQLTVSRMNAQAEWAEAKAQLEVLREESQNPKASPVVSPMTGVVITFDAIDRLLNRTVKPNDPLLQVAAVDGDWELEVFIPESSVGHVRRALEEAEDGRLAVDILVYTQPDRGYRGWLYKDGLGGQVEIHEQEAALKARVQIDDIAREQLQRMPVGTPVKTKIRCGYHPVGYVWFHELWEFFYEKVLF